MTHEEVNAIEDDLRNAESLIEKAAQKLCDERNVADIWRNLNQALSIVGDTIHGLYILRPED